MAKLSYFLGTEFIALLGARLTFHTTEEWASYSHIIFGTESITMVVVKLFSHTTKEWAYYSLIMLRRVVVLRLIFRTPAHRPHYHQGHAAPPRKLQKLLRKCQMCMLWRRNVRIMVSFLTMIPRTPVRIPARAVGVGVTQLSVLPLGLLDKWVPGDIWESTLCLFKTHAHWPVSRNGGLFLSTIWLRGQTTRK